MEKYYKVWLDRNLHLLDIDVVGQINFVGTKFENDQDARIAIQKIYDEGERTNNMREFEITISYPDMLLSDEKHYVSAADYESAENKVREKHPDGIIIRKIVELSPGTINTTI